MLKSNICKKFCIREFAFTVLSLITLLSEIFHPLSKPPVFECRRVDFIQEMYLGKILLHSRLEHFVGFLVLFTLKQQAYHAVFEQWAVALLNSVFQGLNCRGEFVIL